MHLSSKNHSYDTPMTFMLRALRTYCICHFCCRTGSFFVISVLASLYDKIEQSCSLFLHSIADWSTLLFPAILDVFDWTDQEANICGAESKSAKKSPFFLTWSAVEEILQKTKGLGFQPYSWNTISDQFM